MLWLIPLLTGALMMSIAVNLFLVPLKLAEGGVVGVGIILYYKLGLPVWVTILLLNIPIVALGVRVRGWPLLWKTLVGVAAFSGLLALTAGLTPVTDQVVLAITFGGVLMGLGVGLVLRSGGTTGGTEILAIIGQQRFGFTVGTMVMAVDALVLVGAGIAFTPEAAMWSAITLVISSRVVDLVQVGFYAAKGITIITAEPRAVADRILTEVGRGCTIMQGTGAFTGEPRSLLYVVVQRGELTPVKRIVQMTDPRAFVVVADVHEVVGEGFRTGLF